MGPPQLCFFDDACMQDMAATDKGHAKVQQARSDGMRVSSAATQPERPLRRTGPKAVGSDGCCVTDAAAVAAPAASVPEVALAAEPSGAEEEAEGMVPGEWEKAQTQTPSLPVETPAKQGPLTACQLFKASRQAQAGGWGTVLWMRCKNMQTSQPAGYGICELLQLGIACLHFHARTCPGSSRQLFDV